MKTHLGNDPPKDVFKVLGVAKFDEIPPTCTFPTTDGPVYNISVPHGDKTAIILILFNTTASLAGKLKVAPNIGMLLDAVVFSILMRFNLHDFTSRKHKYF